eukprot:9461_1
MSNTEEESGQTLKESLIQLTKQPKELQKAARTLSRLLDHSRNSKTEAIQSNHGTLSRRKDIGSVLEETVSGAMLQSKDSLNVTREMVSDLVQNIFYEAQRRASVMKILIH